MAFENRIQVNIWHRGGGGLNFTQFRRSGGTRASLRRNRGETSGPGSYARREFRVVNWASSCVELDKTSRPGVLRVIDVRQILGFDRKAEAFFDRGSIVLPSEL